MQRCFVALFAIILLTGCGGTTIGKSTPTTSAAAATNCSPAKNGNGPFVYVAIGASDAVGFGATCPERDGYVPLLGTKMPNGAKIVNLGIGGATVKVAQTQELPYALQDHPNLITVWLAANDFRAMQSGSLTLDTYAKQLDALLNTLQAQTQARIYVGNLPDLRQLPAFQHGPEPVDLVAQQTIAWNTAIAGIVTRHGAILVDLYHSDIAAHPEYIFSDGFHPTSLGYQQLAQAFWKVMQTNGDPHV